MSSDGPALAIVIFGASGDLTRRKLIPALYRLYTVGLLPENFQITGAARTDYNDDSFRKHLHEGLEDDPGQAPDAWDEFASRLAYVHGDYDQPGLYQQLKTRLEAAENWLFYLAVPPDVYPAIVRQLGTAGLSGSAPGWARIIVEKPFGQDLESARHLNAKIHADFNEDQVYRIDHYLGKETVQNILAFRFANFVFEKMWDRTSIDYVQITAAEEEGVGERAGYYDQNGVVRDMLQNHLLQLAALIAMEPPEEVSAKTLRDAKLEVLKSVRPFSMDDSAWGQYEGYCLEPGIDPNSNTPTFIAVKMFIDNPRWEGVPFYLRSGKALAAKTTQITIQFKYVPNPIFHTDSKPVSNRLGFCIQPDEGIHLCFQLKTPGGNMSTLPVVMDFHYKDLVGDRTLPEAYERLLLDAIEGDASLFTRSDEIEQAWKLVSSLLDPWEALPDPPLERYPKGSWGPEKAEALMKQDNHEWIDCCGQPEEAKEMDQQALEDNPLLG